MGKHVNILFGFWIAFFGYSKAALSSIVEIPLDSSIKSSSFIFEGIIISSNAFVASDSQVYTASIVRISKIFKGKIACGNIEVITAGGVVGQRGLHEWVEDAFTLSGSGYGGIFMCSPCRFSYNVPRENPVALCPYAGRQSVILYDLSSGDTIPHSTPEYIFKNVYSLYNLIEIKTGHKYSLCLKESQVIKCSILRHKNNRSKILGDPDPPPCLKVVYTENERRKILDSLQNIYQTFYWYCWVSPNPVITTTTITFPTHDRIDIRIRDSSRRVVFHKKNVDGPVLKDIDLTNLKPGIYYGKAITLNGDVAFLFEFRKL